MTKELIIIALILALIYLYYQNKFQSNTITGTTSELKGIGEDFQNFLQTNLNSNKLEELKSKLGEKTLDEILESNSDWETEVDTLTRAKNSLEQDLTVQAESFQARVREKDRELKKLKEDLTNEKKRADNIQQSLASEKQQHKGSLGRITKLTEQITNLEKEKKELSRTKSPIPGEFPESEKKKLEAQIQALETEVERLKEVD